MDSDIPNQPRWLTIVRGIQLLFAVASLGCSAYSLAIFGNYSGYGLNIFSSIFTFIYIGYIVSATIFVYKLYNLWIVIGLQALQAIFWLSTFGTLCTLSVAFAGVSSYSYYYGGYKYSYGGSQWDNVPAVGTTKAATALSAFLWVSFVGTLIYSIISAVRKGRDNSAVTPAGIEESKTDNAASTQPVQTYPAQPYAAPGHEYQQQQQPGAYPVQTGTPAPYAPYQTTGSPAPYQTQQVPYPQPTGSPAPYPTQEVPYPQSTGSPVPFQTQQVPYPQPTGSPAPLPTQQVPYPQHAHEVPANSQQQ